MTDMTGDTTLSTQPSFRAEDVSDELRERFAASLSSKGVSAETLALAAARAADDKRACEVVILNLTELSDVCDYFVLATGSNTRLVDALIDEIEEKLALECGEHPLSIEGRDERTWVLMDYGATIVHVFTPEAREYYSLEHLWEKAPRIDF